jgi:tetratricopeptide (TPR) repeat protein
LPSSSSAQQSGSQVDERFLAAQKDQQQGLLDAAAREYQIVLRLQPGLPEAYVNLGLVYYAQAKFEESARALAKAATLRPGMRGISLWLGIDDVKLNRPSQGTALSDLIYGTHYADGRDWIKSEGHLRRAIERDLRLLDAHLELAEVFLEQGRLPDGQEQLDEAMAMAPRSASVLALSGEVLLLSQRQAEGLSVIAKAVNIDPSAALDALGLPEENRFDQTDGQRCACQALLPKPASRAGSGSRSVYRSCQRCCTCGLICTRRRLGCRASRIPAIQPGALEPGCTSRPLDAGVESDASPPI